MAINEDIRRRFELLGMHLDERGKRLWTSAEAMVLGRGGMGKSAYPDATRLLITADSGGSNGARVKLWKVELQNFANETGLEIQVSHFPPGTSKWNKIEQHLGFRPGFSLIWSTVGNN